MNIAWKELKPTSILVLIWMRTYLGSPTRTTCQKGIRSISTPEQASFSLVFARNKEHAHDWFIQMKSLLNALLCERRLLQFARKEKLFAFTNFGY